ncbi:MAG: sulfite exporter TauE/SafE family protein [Ignavibacteriaceae bacterium]|nr:sulfite exporter TauE/SafE family protein [Ignavibacteriaceae bacterium]
MITLLITSFFAGILTVLTPCSLPLLPIILGGSIENRSKKRPILIIASLGLSVFIFTLLLKTGLNAVLVDDRLIRFVSGVIILVLGLFTVFPFIWEKIVQKLNLSNKASEFLYFSKKRNGYLSAILTGLALGPVFSSCSPMYGYILFAVLPLNFTEGILCLLFFILGMSIFLLLISFLGQKLVSRTKWLSRSDNKLKKILGAIFVVIGILIIFRIDKAMESFLLEQPFIQSLLLNRIEQNIINEF